MNLTILNVGHGDTKLSFDPSKPAERKRASRIVADMMKLGYSICVREGDRWIRASGFDPEKTEYLIKEGRRGTSRTRRVAAEMAPAVSVGRSAGGMSTQIDSIEHQNLRSFDRLTSVRDALRHLADERQQWAGIPMPLDDQPLVVEPSYPFAECFARKPLEGMEGVVCRNQFYSTRLRADVLIWQEPNGRLQWGIERVSRVALEAHTLGASAAWGIEQEANALQTLAELVRHSQFKTYLLSGAFIETSPRSHVSYIFRKLRPTLAMRPNDDGQMRLLAALCMHPIAYYEESWAGAMCPTDDVLAHLTLMRADERLYWRRCNQHPGYRTEAGL